MLEDVNPNDVLRGMEVYFDTPFTINKNSIYFITRVSLPEDHCELSSPLILQAPFHRTAESTYNYVE